MRTLRTIISRHIYRIVLISACVMLVVMLGFQLMHEQRKAYQDADRTFLQMEQILAENEEELIKIRTEYAESCLHAAETVSRIIEGDLKALYSADKLKEIAAEVEVDEIHIFGGDGKIFSGTLPQYYGYTVDSGEQMSFFKPMLTDKNLKLVQDITNNTAEDKLMQYSAVWSGNGEFIVQVGMNPVKVIKATEKNELSYIFSLFRVNPNISYYAIDEESGVIVGSNNLGAVGDKCSDEGFRFEDIKSKQKGFWNKINGQYSFCVFQKIASNYIGRVISFSYLYQSIPHIMTLIFVGLMIVSFILAISITRYINKYVIDKIHEVIQKLELITEGSLEERVDVRSSLEFQELSNYINQMVQSLLRINNTEQQINETLRTALQAADPEKSLDVVLECLGKSLGGERSYIFEKNNLGHDDNTYEWVAEGISPEKDNLQNVPPEVCESWYRRFSEKKSVVFENIDEIKEKEPLQYEILKNQNIVSVAVVPLYNDSNVIGFYGVDNPPVEMLDHATNMLRIMGHFIDSLIKIRNLVRNLKQMSYLDQLTQIGNRHALWEYVDNINMDMGIGVIYCDITGLKRVNDNEGHEAGDRLILSSCECMKNALNGYELFRLGGDELLAARSGISEEELQEGVKKLRESMKEHSVVLAMGAVWKSDCTEGVNSIIAEAESLMYKDKAEYYVTAGIERRQR